MGNEIDPPDLAHLVELQAQREGFPRWVLAVAGILSDECRKKAAQEGKPLLEVLCYLRLPDSVSIEKLLSCLNDYDEAPSSSEDLRQLWERPLGMRSAERPLSPKDFRRRCGGYGELLQDIKAEIAGEAWKGEFGEQGGPGEE